jgi:hypothetical protein
VKSVQRHLAYLNRKCALEIETDERERIAGEGVERELLDDWDLDLEVDRRRVELGRARLLATRAGVERGWLAVGEILTNQGQTELASQVRRFAAGMPPAVTERELIAEALRSRTQEPRRRDGPVQTR